MKFTVVQYCPRCGAEIGEEGTFTEAMMTYATVRSRHNCNIKNEIKAAAESQEKENAK